MYISIFEGFDNPVEDKPSCEIINEIISEKYKNEIKEIRRFLTEGESKAAREIKKQLPAFTTSGKFIGGRKKENLAVYSYLIILDFDKVNLPEFYVKWTVAEPYTYACFISASGNGFKVIVKVSSDAKFHEQAFEQVCEFYENRLRLKADRGKEINRLYFMSYDPNAYINENAKTFVVHTISVENTPITNAATKKESNIWDRVFEQCKVFMNNLHQYEEGNRNNYIHSLACNSNRWGIPEKQALHYILRDFDLDPPEINSCVKSAYNNKSDFALIKKNVSADEDLHVDEEDPLLNMPYIPEEIFSMLPKILKEACGPFSPGRQKDVFLTSALGVLSGCFPTVEGIYDRQVVSPNLYTYVVAPPASDKSALKYAKTLGSVYHNRLVKEGEDAKRAYNLTLLQNQMRQDDLKNPGLIEAKDLTPPGNKTLFIPGNASAAAVIKHLMDAGGNGIFCETEAETITNTIKQDWGGFLDMFLKAFHNEEISYTRKTKNEYYVINKPQISVGLTSTPYQIFGLIKSAADGLLSRFIFYIYKTAAEWRSMRPNDEPISLTDQFEALSEQVHTIITYFETFRWKYDLTSAQWDLFDNIFSTWLQEVNEFVSQDATQIIKRLGLIVYRISMILSILRLDPKEATNNRIICNDTDFQIALELGKVYKEHSLYVFSILSKNGKNVGVADRNLKLFYQQLPELFTRKDAVGVGKKLLIGDRTVDKHLAKLCDSGFLTKPKYGEYSKVNSDETKHNEAA